MERKIGEIFTYNGKIYQVVESNTCESCAFKNGRCLSISKLLGLCSYTNRTDKTGVIFKEINNMEIKNNQLTIDIPEGMEIDLKNSDLAKGIVKFKSKWLTLEQIYKESNYNTHRSSIIDFSDSKLVAIAKLMDIAKYFNDNWKYKVNSGECGYMIAYDRSIKEPYYKVNAIYPTTDVYYGNSIFKNETDAQYVIDNPNFRDILDAIYKN